MEADMAKGFFESTKGKVTKFLHEFNYSWDNISNLAIGFGGGFLLGFLIKRYARHTIFLLIILAGALVALDYVQLITINWASLRDFIGLTSDHTSLTIIQNGFSWAKEHISITIAGMIGFIIGFKIG